MKLLGFVFAMFYAVSAVAQNVVTREHNMPCSGDEVSKEQVEFVDCGDSGENVFWNYCDVPVLKSDYKVCYSGDSVLTAITPNAIYRYLHDGAGLQFIGFENPLVIMDYNVPVTQVVYPMAYGDTVVSEFNGTGKYSNVYDVIRTGQILHEADAIGAMALIEGDTLRNVLRIHSVRTCAVQMNVDTAYVDTLKNIKQEIEEQYTWYARGYRYPVFETLSRTTFDNMRPVSVYQTAFRCLPEEQRELADSLNEDIARKDSILGPGHLPPRPVVMTSRHVAVNGSTVTVSYDMEADAHVTFIVAGTAGMLYRKKELNCEKGTCHSTVIDCGGLRSGEYILYINVGGNVESEIIVL